MLSLVSKGLRTQTTEGSICWWIVQELTAPLSKLHFRPGYTYPPSQSLDAELRQCIGQAKQAIAMLGRPILANRHFPFPLQGAGGDTTFQWSWDLEDSDFEADANIANLLHQLP